MSDTHDDLVVLAPAYVLGALEPDERRVFETHLAGCDVCASEVRSLGRVTAGLAQAVPQVTPRAALRDRVLRAVAGEDPATAVGADPSTADGARDARHHQTDTSRRWATSNWLAYAACVALATVAVLYAMNLRARVESLEARLEVAQLRLAAADRAMVDARRVAFETQSAMAVLAAADLTRVDLQGAPAAPQAAGRALWSRQSGMVFAATNLPPLEEKRIYQVWVVPGGGAAPISAGLVAPDETGRGVAIFRTPIDVTGPVTVAVTIEPEGGVPAPTGAFYLTGKSATGV
jgi:anti-sigma-K factor RskA